MIDPQNQEDLTGFPPVDLNFPECGDAWKKQLEDIDELMRSEAGREQCRIAVEVHNTAINTETHKTNAEFSPSGQLNPYTACGVHTIPPAGRGSHQSPSKTPYDWTSWAGDWVGSWQKADAGPVILLGPDKWHFPITKPDKTFFQPVSFSDHDGWNQSQAGQTQVWGWDPKESGGNPASSHVGYPFSSGDSKYKGLVWATGDSVFIETVGAGKKTSASNHGDNGQWTILQQQGSHEPTAV